MKVVKGKLQDDEDLRMQRQAQLEGLLPLLMRHDNIVRTYKVCTETDREQPAQRGDAYDDEDPDDPMTSHVGLRSRACFNCAPLSTDSLGSRGTALPPSRAGLR